MGHPPSGGRTVRVPPPCWPREIGWAKARGLAPDGYDRGRSRRAARSDAPPVTWSTASAPTRPPSIDAEALDLDDLLVRAGELLETDDGFAERMRWRYRHLSVDEFQDVNPAQFRLIRALLGGSPDLCVVGDPNQAIYGWNGADPTLLGRLP